MILLNHPTGNTFSRALLKGLLEHGQLGLFATALAFQKSGGWLRALPGNLRAEILRRQFDAPGGKTFTRPTREVIRLLAGRFGWRSLLAPETGWACIEAVYRDLDQALAKQLKHLARQHALTGVYAYEMGALWQFRAARELGLKCYYDLPIAYWETGRRLLREEAERWPAWGPTLQGARDSEEKRRAKTEEAELADVIFCPSEFVRESLPEKLREGRRCVVAEFGSPPRQKPPEFNRAGEKLRVLFAGSMTQRKGLADVFAAMKLLRRADVELVVMGSTLAPMAFYRSECPGFTYEPPRPHEEVLRLMETCDVLLLPSIVEGRALVQQEAMSRGLILLATPNAGGQDLIVEGRTGFLLPIRSPAAIAERLDWLADRKSLLPEMKRAACAMAAEATWERYVQKILDAMREIPAPETDGGAACKAAAPR